MNMEKPMENPTEHELSEEEQKEALETVEKVIEGEELE